MIRTTCTNSTNELLENSKENKRNIGAPMPKTESTTHETIEQEDERHNVDRPRRNMSGVQRTQQRQQKE